MPDPKPDERVPDYHGPRTDWDPAFAPHQRVWETSKDLLNGRVTNSEARRELRKALDVADASAPKPSPIR